MHSFKDKQTNPGETLSLQKTADTINNLIEYLSIPKSLSSAETTTTPDTPTTPAANENSGPEQVTCTGICALLNKDRSKTQNNLADKSDREDGSKKGKDDSGSNTQQFEMLRNNLNQIKDSLIQIQMFEKSDLFKALQAHLRFLEAKFGTLKDKNEPTPSPNAPLSSPEVSSSGLHDINKKLMKIKYQIPSFRRLSFTSSKAHSRTSSGSNEGSSVQESPKLHECERFTQTSFYIEIKGIFDRLKKEEKFILSRFAVLTEGAVVKRRVLTYWGLGVGYISDLETKEKTPEEIVDNILEKLQEMGFIEPAMRKRKQKIRSYKMDPLVRSAMIMICEKKKSDGDSNGNAVGYSTTSNKTFFLKGEEKFLDGESPSKEGEDQSQNLDPEKLVTLFNVNEHSADTQLSDLAKKSKYVKVEDWLSKMKSLKVLYLGRWREDSGYHIEVKDTAFLKVLKSMEELKFLSLQGISRIKELPRSIGMLTNLVVLDLKDCYNLELLPVEISSLTKLRYLDISNCYLLGNMPKKLSSLSELQVLKGFIIGGLQRGNLGTLEDLKGLKKLKKLTIIATRNDFPTPTDLSALQGLTVLQKLTIAWGVQRIYPEDETSARGKAAGSPVHPSDKLPNKLEKLDLQCFPYSTPTWLTPDDLPNLKKLYIKGGNFTTFKKGKWKVEALRLKYLREMKTNWRELKELFPKLVYLERVKCPGITLCPCDENGEWQNPKI